MQEHVIYYFSGTGNSLRAALGVQKALTSCDVIALGRPDLNKLAQPTKKLASIGFVFPCYFGSVPQGVLSNIASLDLSEQKGTYVYSVITYGAFLGQAVRQLACALQDLGTQLCYAAPVKAFANYVVRYDMSKRVAEKTAATKARLQVVIPEIVAQTCQSKKGFTQGLFAGHPGRKDMRSRDEHFTVSESCNGCGLCEQVCPVGNLELVGERPRWLHRCEQCLACLHWCPERAINYGAKTRKRGRYTNPEITAKMFIDYQNGGGAVGE